MKEMFSFEFDWLPGEYGSDVDQCTAADLGVRVDNVYFTKLEDLRAKTVRQRMRVSANVLALWLAGNWWRLRWETERSDLDWRMSHCMAAAGGGHVWPNLFFCGDGESVRLESTLPAHCDFPVRYLYNICKTVAVGDFVSGVDHFIEAVIARLNDNNLCDNALVNLWREVQQERHDPALASYRKMEALLGYDADECPDSLMVDLDALSGKYGRDAIEEIASACGSDVLATIHALVSDGGTQSITVPGSADIRAGMQRVDGQSGARPWVLAEAMAKRTRKAWNIEPHATISTATFAGIVSASPTLLENSSVTNKLQMSAGFRSKHQHGCISVVLDKKRITSRRFALARIIGDNLYAKQKDQILPATHAATARQKFQRAFAQELLCPFAGLISVLGTHVSDDDAIEDAASKFEVSPLLVKTTMVNKGMLKRDALMSLNTDDRQST